MNFTEKNLKIILAWEVNFGLKSSPLIIQFINVKLQIEASGTFCFKGAIQKQCSKKPSLRKRFAFISDN
jgi:hypothetical protein